MKSNEEPSIPLKRSIKERLKLFESIEENKSKPPTPPPKPTLNPKIKNLINNFKERDKGWVKPVSPDLKTSPKKESLKRSEKKNSITKNSIKKQPFKTIVEIQDISSFIDDSPSPARNNKESNSNSDDTIPMNLSNTFLDKNGNENPQETIMENRKTSNLEDNNTKNLENGMDKKEEQNLDKVEENSSEPQRTVSIKINIENNDEEEEEEEGEQEKMNGENQNETPKKRKKKLGKKHLSLGNSFYVNKKTDSPLPKTIVSMQVNDTDFQEEIKKHDNLQKNLRKRKNLSMELLSTEKTYVSSLESLVNNFKNPIEKSGLIDLNDIRVIFLNAETLIPIHKKLLLDLEVRLSQWSDESCIGDIIKSLAPFMKLYVDYVNGFNDSEQCISNLLKKSEKLKNFIDNCDKVTKNGVNQFFSLHICPIQRIPRFLF